MTPVAIRQLRERHNLDRRQFAQLVWQSERAVSGWEYGERNIPKALYELLLIKLGEDELLAELTGGSNEGRN